ncbi:MAG: relaxase domain-containing protein [bacterium]|nr:relaxase domain-containing protein [bacterium]
MVATVHELASSATAVSYYEKDGYYAKDDPEHRKASFWHGSATIALGLRGHVVPSRFESVLDGRVPKSDIRLGRIVDGKRQHRPGWDITFSAPKSVSLEALVTGDARVIRAHDEAVRATLDWIDRDLLQTRGWDPATKRRPRVKADGSVVAGFRHLTSRDLDPQLHTHCVLANMTRTPDGAWKSVEPTLLRRSEKLIGAHYRNELAARLEALGLAVTPRMIGPVPGFELAGYGQDFLDAFSGRRREILAYLDRHGLPHTKEATQKATLHTRRRKVEAGLDDLVPQWRQRARDLGLTRDGLALRPPRPVDPATGRETPVPAVPGPALTKNEKRKRRRAPALPALVPETGSVDAGLPGQTPPAPREVVAEPETGCLEAVARAVAHFEERRTVIPVSEIRALALGHAPGRYRLAEIDEAIERLVADRHLREVAVRGHDRAFVTDRAVKAERRIIGAVRRGKGETAALVASDDVEARTRSTTLTAGQRRAVRLILGEGDAVTGVQGHAGSGKTTMLRTVADLLGREQITGLAPSAAAARVLAKETGIRTRTLQWFLVRHEDLSDPVRLARCREEYAGSVLAVDEASMIGTVQMERLLAVAAKLAIRRVVLVGDTRQLKSITAGGPFRLMQKSGMATAVMDEVLRQKDPDLKVAVSHAREGEVREAVTRLDNRVFEMKVEDLGAEAARRWLALPVEERARTALLAPTHAIRRDINERVREGLADEGLLHGRTLVIERLVDRRFTREQTSRISNYEKGDVIVFHRDAYGCRRDDVATVTGFEDGQVVLDLGHGHERRFRPSGNAARNLAVCTTAGIEVRAGDRIRWTRNRKERPGRYPVPALVNGEEARILAIESRRVRIKGDDGTEFSLSRDDSQLRHLDHAWSSTVHGAQGRTAPKVIAVLGAGGMAEQDLFYVEVSRASEGFSLLTDDREALIEKLETSYAVPDSALDALGEDLDLPVVDPDEAAALVADWEALVRETDGSGQPAASLGAYDEVMARVASFAAIEDLPDDLRAFTRSCLARHEAARAAAEGVRRLLADLQDHARRWPELVWAADAAETAQLNAWRDRCDALMERARTLDGSRLAGVADGEAALAASVKRLEAVFRRDTAARFLARVEALPEGALDDAVSFMELPGGSAIERLAWDIGDGEDLDEAQARAFQRWQDLWRRERDLVDDLRQLAIDLSGLAANLALIADLDHAADVDPRDRDVVLWMKDAGTLLADVAEAQTPGTAGARILALDKDLGREIAGTAARVERGLAACKGATLLWRLRDALKTAMAQSVLPVDAPDWPALVGEVRAAVARDDPNALRVLALGAYLTMDERWRGERERTAACVRHLQHLEEDRPRYGTTSDADAWALKCEAVGEEAAALRRDIDSSELDAHLRSCRLDREAFDRLSGAIPGWQATADALRSLEAWQARAAALLGEKTDDRTAWRGEAAALLAEGRTMAESAVMGSPDMAGAGLAIEEATGAIDAALLANEVAALRALARAVNREVKEKGCMALDAARFPELAAALDQLDGRAGLDDDTRDLVAGWQAHKARREEERSRVAGVIGDLRQRGAARPRFGLARDRAAWRRATGASLAAAEALKASLPTDQLAAHLAGLGGEPELLDRLAASLAEGRQTADALDDLDAWKTRVASALAAKADDREAWRGEVTALLDDGRAMAGTAVMRSPGMAGAGPAIDAALRDIGAALLADEVAALRALAREVKREVKKKGGVALDAARFPELDVALDRLDGRDGLDDDTRSFIARWQDAISGLQRRRNEVAVFWRRLASLDDAMANHERQGTSLPAALRREAAALSKEDGTVVNQMPGKERAAHIRSAGGKPGDVAAFFSGLPQRLEADDAMRDEENRRDHLVRLGQARRRLRAARTATSASLPWTLAEPLVPGDRLVWRDGGGARDEIVMEASYRQNDGRTTLLVTVPAAAPPGDAIERSRIRDEFDLVRLDAQAGIRRLVWPDEGLREMEIGRQHPSPDQEFSLRCEDRVVEGDHVRWVMESEGLLDDRPQVEARVERIEPTPGRGGGDVAVLTVIRSWGLEDPPAPGSEIRQTMAALTERSCLRQRRDDEDVRAAKLAEAEERIRAYRPGPSWGFRM